MRSTVWWTGSSTIPGSALSIPADGNSLIRSGASFVSGNNTPTNLSNQTGHVPSTGDMNGDGVVNTLDIPRFVNVLLEINTDPVQIIRADFDCSGSADGDDTAGFIAALLP